MKKTIFISFFVVIFQLNAQETLDLKKWKIGLGTSNFSMIGDFKSSNSYNTFWNIGAYINIGYTISKNIELEIKYNFSAISSNIESKSIIKNSILYLPPNIVNNQKYLYSEGKIKGGELNIAFNTSTIFDFDLNKFRFKNYLGIGYHKYYNTVYGKTENGNTIKLIEYRNVDTKNPPIYDSFGNQINDTSDYNLSSFYLNFQMAFNYQLIKNTLNLEFRPSINYNFEDDLDGAISDRKDSELFFYLNLGLNYRFNI